MPGSKNRKKEKNNDGYNNSKNEDAARWSKKIEDVSKISFKLDINTRKDLFAAIEAYFEVLKYAFPRDIIKRATQVNKNLVSDAGSLNDDLQLTTLKDKNEGQTVKWLNKVNGLFTEFAKINVNDASFAKINVNDASDKEKFVGELPEKCKRFNSLMKISPTYIGHKPLFKYKNVRAAFKELGNTVASLPDLVKDEIKKPPKQAKAKPHKGGRKTEREMVR